MIKTKHRKITKKVEVLKVEETEVIQIEVDPKVLWSVRYAIQRVLEPDGRQLYNLTEEGEKRLRDFLRGTPT